MTVIHKPKKAKSTGRGGIVFLILLPVVSGATICLQDPFFFKKKKQNTKTAIRSQEDEL